jgi:hypothetical protein
MTQQAIDPNALIMGGAARSASFKEINDQVWGTIMSSKVQQQREMNGDPKFYKDTGNPMMQVVITLLTDLRDDDDDDGLRSVYAKGQMLNAIRTAVVKAGAKGIADGGQLVVRYTGDAAPTQKGFNGAKQYIAKYEPPTFVTELPEDEGIDQDDLPF